MISWTVFHTQEAWAKRLGFPILACGNYQWLGDGYYFWKDYEFSELWGENKKCPKGGSRKFDIYKATLEFEEDELIDTVFNENDYYQFIKNVELFAKKYEKKKKKKPTLEEFNDFISDYGLWQEIKIIQFQDVPTKNNRLLKVKNFFYKKRIQIRVNKANIVTKFEHFREKDCI